jgi:integration host factor subunit beta
MIKSEISDILSKKITHLPEKTIATSINTILKLMSDTLINNGRIEIRGFGSFSLNYKEPRIAHNPKTLEKVKTSGKYSPHFKPGKELRDRIDASRLHNPIKDDN